MILTRKTEFISLGIVLAMLLPWLKALMNASPNTNHAWLMILAERYLEHGYSVQNFFETNPPLSVLIYIPPALLHLVFDIPPYIAPYIYSLFVLGISCLLVWKLLEGLPYIDLHTDRPLILAGYIVGSTFQSTIIYFGDRDAFVLWGLLPFLLFQLSLTYGTLGNKKLYYPLMFICAYLILLKPHYGLFVLIPLVHRWIKTGSIIKIITSADFIILSLACTSYVLAVFFFFEDYWRIILPELLSYINIKSGAIFKKWLVLFFIISACVAFVSLSYFKSDKKILITWFFMGAYLSLFLFLLQMKGFHYHLIPTLSFLYIGLFLTIFYIVEPFFKKLKSLDYFVLIAILIITGSKFAYNPKGHPTHAEFRNTEFVKLVEPCAPECSFFIIRFNMEAVHQVAIYTGSEHASRYPGLWALYDMLEEDKKSDPAAKTLKNKYAEDMAYDFARYKPEVMAILSNFALAEVNFNFIEFFSENEKFKKEIAHYEKTGTMSIRLDDYFADIILGPNKDIVEHYDIYRRKK